ncbi:hypothetical protein [Pseudalkalibacillus decolorationis]|nr:hypothetical protein [Pseudalkalibacillus decolorationis]
MTFIEVFGWTMTGILGIMFICSLVAVSKKPKAITKRNEEEGED